jgi:hypothetical protein
MTGMKLGVAILGLAALAGVSRVEKSVSCILCNDPRALYLMAQYKIAVGDSTTALELVRKAKIADANCPGKRTSEPTVSCTSCPHEQRG